MDDHLHKPRTTNAVKYKASLRACCIVMITVSSSFLVMGCREKNEDVVSFLKAHEHVVSAGDYSLAPPDIIRVAAPIAPEVDGGVHMIRTDGKISLKLLGEVKLAGLTTQEAAVKLESLLNKYYVDAKVNIEVAGYQSKHIYVMGEVGSPGPRPYTGRDSFLDVVSRARPTFLAWKAKVEIIRPDPVEGKRKKLVLDYDKMVREGDLTANVLLQEGDVVYVPPTPLAWVGLRVRELLFPMQPVLEAYSGPARAISATDVYQDNDDDNDDDRRFSILR
jgi:polysaccharide export outer membrane protein